MNVTLCSGADANISCGFTEVSDPIGTLPNWSWRIIERSNDGDVISNKTVRVMDINANNTDGLRFIISSSDVNGIRNANNSYLSVGPVDDSYNNTSYQCIFTINDTIIESDTAGTVTVIGMHVYNIRMYYVTVLDKRFLKRTQNSKFGVCLCMHKFIWLSIVSLSLCNFPQVPRALQF